MAIKVAVARSTRPRCLWITAAMPAKRSGAAASMGGHVGFSNTNSAGITVSDQSQQKTIPTAAIKPKVCTGSILAATKERKASAVVMLVLGACLSAAGAEDAWQFVLSPDGEWLAFVGPDPRGGGRKLLKMPASGGSPIVLGAVRIVGYATASTLWAFITARTSPPGMPNAWRHPASWRRWAIT